MARQTSTGKCNLCGGTFSKAAMTKHIASCRQKEGAPQSPSTGGNPQKTKTFHIVVEGRGLPEYWMHLEAPAGVEISVLDEFLRRTWLECCGHMSAFKIGGQTYSCAPEQDLDDESFDVQLDDVLSPGLQFYHEYDFGSTTHLKLKVVSSGESWTKDKTVRILARNDPPQIPCSSCGQIATQVCVQCIWQGKGWLCNKCVTSHKCGDDMLLPVVNSPRVGVCGYTG